MASMGNDPRAPSRHETPAESAERVRREAQRTADEASRGLHAAGDTARSKVEEYQDEAKSAISRLTGDAKARARAAVEDRKNASAQDVADIAHALRTSADDLEQRDRTAAAGYVRQAAGGLEQFADSLQRRDLDDMVRQTEEFARRQPGLFVGGAVVAGFALARFLKSSADRRRTEAYGEPYRGAPTASGGYDPTTTRGRFGASGSDVAGGTTGAATGSAAASSSGPGAPDRHFNPTQEGHLHGNR